jgi:hypothetical protein
MRALILASAVLYASAAIAADWVFLANNGDKHLGNKIFYDKTSIVSTSGDRKVWIKFRGFTLREDVLTFSGHDSQQLWKVDCHERTYVILTVLSGGHDLSEMVDHSPVDIQPESWMELLHEQVCR